LNAAVDVMLPKSESEDVIAAVHAGARAPLVLLVETVAGLVNVRRMAACAGVARIAFGSVDFCSVPAEAKADMLRPLSQI
jgi:citrate lyase subunit beta/citryl-CoA lyase